MTLQKEDILVLEEMIRKVVREEIRNAVTQNSSDGKFANEDDFQKAAAKVFSKHKKVLDALA